MMAQLNYSSEKVDNKHWYNRLPQRWIYLIRFFAVLLFIGLIAYYAATTMAATRQLLANPFFTNQLGPWSNIPPEYVTASGVRMGLRFNGVDNGVNLASNFTAATADTFTFEFWVKPETTHEIDVQSNSGTAGASGQKYALAPDARTGNDAGMGISVGTNGVSVYENSDGYAPALLVHDMTSTPITTWTHIAVVYNNKTPTLYINGQLAKTGLSGTKTGSVYPGKTFGWHSYGGFQGEMSDIRIWNTARTRPEIQSTMNSSLAGNEMWLAGYWKVNEGIGSTVSDSTSIQRHGSFRNNPSWVLIPGGSSAVAASGPRLGLGFNGTTSNGINLSPGFTAPSNTFTYEFWAKPEAPHEIDAQSNSSTTGTSGQRYAIGPNYRSGNDAGMGVSVGTNGISVYEHANAYMPSLLVYDVSPGTISSWVHIAVVYNNKTPSLYVNGQLVILYGMRHTTHGYMPGAPVQATTALFRLFL